VMVEPASGTSNTSVQNVYATAIARTAGMTVPQAQPQQTSTPARTWLAVLAVMLSAAAGFVMWKVILGP